MDLCNAVSVAYAVPVAVLDVDRITGPLLEVRPARGDETYTAFGGGVERPRARRGDLRRLRRPGARPPLDPPAERALGGRRAHRAGAGGGGGDARRRRGDRGRGAEDGRGGGGGALGGHHGDGRAHPGRP
ncbi:hypothetical protein LT493_22975 [Streptomyces tricolor]|nr:hypothetical protein [Streptomyces tricolor]